MILPSLVSPFGLYLMRIYAAGRRPGQLIEAARIDGAGEFRIFFRIALRLLGSRASSRCCCSPWSRPGTTTSCR